MINGKKEEFCTRLRGDCNDDNEVLMEEDAIRKLQIKA